MDGLSHRWRGVAHGAPLRARYAVVPAPPSPSPVSSECRRETRPRGVVIDGQMGRPTLARFGQVRRGPTLRRHSELSC
jgi:hypothetical protein